VEIKHLNLVEFAKSLIESVINIMLNASGKEQNRREDSWKCVSGRRSICEPFNIEMRVDDI
jgi:hypothetical protein